MVIDVCLSTCWRTSIRKHASKLVKTINFQRNTAGHNFYFSEIYVLDKSANVALKKNELKSESELIKGKMYGNIGDKCNI